MADDPQELETTVGTEHRQNPLMLVTSWLYIGRKPHNIIPFDRRHTGDIHTLSVVGLFMTPIGQWKRLDRVMVECTCLLHIGPP